METPIVLVSGHLNGIHPQHVLLLKYASSLGELTVGINGDAVNARKNGARAIPARDRMYLLEELRCVSKVLIFEEDTPAELIRMLKPSWYVKGPDYKDCLLPEQAACDEVGAQIVFRPGDYVYSSRVLFT